MVNIMAIFLGKPMDGVGIGMKGCFPTGGAQCPFQFSDA
jgi:hypothetical protein